MKKVFVLEHVHEHEKGNENIKLIGIYSSKKNAEEAISQLVCVSGFKDTPDGFHVDEYELDQTQWLDGYVTE